MLHGLVTELVVPAIKQKDTEVRASGLICLGLVALLDKVSGLSLQWPASSLLITVWWPRRRRSIRSNCWPGKVRTRKASCK